MLNVPLSGRWMLCWLHWWTRWTGSLLSWTVHSRYSRFWREQGWGRPWRGASWEEWDGAWDLVLVCHFPPTPGPFRGAGSWRFCLPEDTILTNDPRLRLLHLAWELGWKSRNGMKKPTTSFLCCGPDCNFEVNDEMFSSLNPKAWHIVGT